MFVYDANGTTITLQPTAETEQQVQTVSADMFGAIQTGFQNFSGFEEQSETLGVTHVRWPGGTLSEAQEDVYGLDVPGIFDGTKLYNEDPDRDRPDLSDMLSSVTENGQSFSMIIPTVRYADDIETGQADLETFLTDLLAGEYGTLPEDFTIEIGNEYKNFDIFADDPGLYGQVANALVETAAGVLNDPELNPQGHDINIAVQMGYNHSDDVAIRDAFSQDALAAVDTLVVHSLPIGLQNLTRVETGEDPEDEGETIFESTEDYLAAWSAAIEDAGGTADPELYLSAWTVGGSGMSADGLDLDYYDYGLAGASTALELFSGFTSIGVDAAALWGVDVDNLNHFINDQGGVIETSPAGAMVQMMSETLIGAELLGSYTPASRDDTFIMHAYQTSDELIVYLGANDADVLSTTLDFSVFEDAEVTSLRILSSELPADDAQYAGTAAEELHEEAVIRTVTPQVADGALGLTFDKQYEVAEIRLSVSDADLAAVAAEYGIAPVEPVEPEIMAKPTSGADTLLGTEGNDEISGWAGDDTLMGNAGDDNLSGNAGNDTLDGGLGDDFLTGGSGDDIFIYGGDAGIDVVRDYNPAEDSIRLGSDLLQPGETLDDLLARVAGEWEGNVVMRFDDANRLIVKNANLDDLRVELADSEDDADEADSTAPVQSGGVSNDTNESSETEVVEEAPAEPVEASSAVAPDMWAASSSFWAAFDGSGVAASSSSSEQEEEATPEPQAQVATGPSDGDDILAGTDADDAISGWAGDDVLSGGEGNDALYGNKGADQLHGGGGDDALRGGAHNDQLFGDAGQDSLVGGGGDDVIYGGADDDTLEGWGGADVLMGDAGDDRLSGNAGDDILNGGAGNDFLTGGTGNDVFIYGADAGIDVVRDYNAAEDRVLLESALLQDGESLDDLLSRAASEWQGNVVLNFGEDHRLIVQGTELDDLQVDIGADDDDADVS
ncbi:calcium-binding protein [Rhodovulum adriaticum]|uniref:Ca2+-binding RTX toxin-like protein n=1 Tax=Rhodovulum adriaticum TaxID=35804 RepID=A0A4R2NLJ5_RHOAD|nr:calcium-binding protein [Rhodovulum adriaticum]MBK1637269.1 hypothetical protein [Rhodovulum adriaticum]TCP22420.1 Ca2+-binding RTX toxin-like protein [Rhodovulum adriaticum]